MSNANATKITGTDPEKPPITNDKSDNTGRGDTSKSKPSFFSFL